MIGFAKFMKKYNIYDILYVAILHDKLNGANLISEISTHFFYKFSQIDSSVTLKHIKSFFLRKRQYLQNTTNAFHTILIYTTCKHSQSMYKR